MPNPDQPTRSPGNRRNAGGVIHTYQGYDAVELPGPISQMNQQADLASLGMEHMLTYGSMRHFTEEELANAIHLDPSQIDGLGPSLEALIALLEERKRKILETYETSHARRTAEQNYLVDAQSLDPPKKQRKTYQKAVGDFQLADLKKLWYRQDDQNTPFATGILHVMEALASVYQIEKLASDYRFTGREKMSVEKALEIKAELEQIDKLLEQLKQAEQTAQLAIIDMDQLSEYAEPGQMEQLESLQRQIEQMLQEEARRQGLEPGKPGQGFELTPKAYRLFQSRVLETIFADLTASKSGRHQGEVTGEGSVETQRTRPYEFGDAVAHMDLTATMTNAMFRQQNKGPLRLQPDDIEVHLTRNNPKCATVVIVDMSGSMRHGGQYIDAKRMALALQGLIQSEYPGDFLGFIEMYTVARVRRLNQIAEMMPKVPTIRDPVVRLRADMSDPDMSEYRIPQHFTNMQHAIQLARRLLAAQDTPNRQIVLISDGLPTAHYEDKELFMLYPPDPRTESATIREALLAKQDNITINMFVVPSWSQDEDDVRFCNRIAQTTGGRVFFTAGHDLDRYVIWDYVKQRKTIVG
ncbi:VWA domain-containing protein [Mucisphaera sp.]|uniref:VWA domain-containing protein n=1 Tax=Mucisphaera sp. TaxID=2913024 RepID=UPI003D1169DE